MKWSFIVGVILVVIVVVGLLLAWPSSSPEDEAPVAPEPEFNNVSDGSGQFIQLAPEEEPEAAREGSLAEQEASEEVIIDISDVAFAPEQVEVSVGTTVTFVNNGQGQHWPASDVHPTHTSYPGSDISKCETDEADSIFDACRGLQTGESYSFTFEEVGAWEYHDHLQPQLGGTITVTSE